MSWVPEFDPHSLPELRDWDRGTGGAGLFSFIGQEGTFAHALATLWLCLPDVVQVRGCVVLQERYEPRSFEHWWDRLAGDTRRVENVLNHVHVRDVFTREDVPEEALSQFTLRLAALWRCALPVKVPDRRFEVQIELSPEYDGPTLSFSSYPLNEQ
jgi:hypothetical protein